jgi:hypothetical protein
MNYINKGAFIIDVGGMGEKLGARRFSPMKRGTAILVNQILGGLGIEGRHIYNFQKS